MTVGPPETLRIWRLVHRDIVKGHRAFEDDGLIVIEGGQVAADGLRGLHARGTDIAGRPFSRRHADHLLVRTFPADTGVLQPRK